MKNWFGKKDATPESKRKLTVDELMTLGRHDEARVELEDRLRRNLRDRRTMVKLGEALLALRRPSEALEMFEGAAQSYAGDGFHDKSRAILHKILRIAPNHEKAIVGLEQLDRAKEREARRRVVQRHLKSPSEANATQLDAFTLDQIWKALSRSSVIEAFDTRTLGRLFERLELRQVAPNVQLIDPGETLEEYYLVASGSIEVVQERSGAAPVILRTYLPGDAFGEGALLEHRPWVAIHRTAKASRLLCLTPDALAAILPGTEDPRGFLDALRLQRHDASLAAMIRTGQEV